MEAAALAIFMAFRRGAAGVFLASCAMGIQSATLSRFNGVTVYTCFVTGSPVRFSENLSDYLMRQVDLRGSVWFAGVWAAYVLGAFLGAAALAHIAGFAVALAIGALSSLTIVDLISPSEVDTAVAEPESVSK